MLMKREGRTIKMVTMKLVMTKMAMTKIMKKMMEDGSRDRPPLPAASTAQAQRVWTRRAAR